MHVKNLASRTQTVSITVVSKSSTPGEYPIAAQAFWGRRDMNLIVPGRDPDRQALYASVSKGTVPAVLILLFSVYIQIIIYYTSSVTARTRNVELTQKA